MYHTQELRKRLRKGWRPLAWGMLCRSRHYQPFTEADEGIELGRFSAHESPRGAILAARERHEGRPWRPFDVGEIAFLPLGLVGRDVGL